MRGSTSPGSGLMRLTVGGEGKGFLRIKSRAEIIETARFSNV